MTRKKTTSYSEGSALAERKRGLEEEYFRNQERELVEKLRRRARTDADRKKMADTLGSGDQETLDHLQDMGYTPDTVSLLYLVPLVEVAWAEGTVTKRERELILKLAAARGIEESSAAFKQLNGWLDMRPSEDFFENTLRVISALLIHQTPEQSESHRRDLVSYCTEIARVSGGLLGIGAISDEERAVIEHVVHDLKPYRRN